MVAVGCGAGLCGAGHGGCVGGGGENGAIVPVGFGEVTGRVTTETGAVVSGAVVSSVCARCGFGDGVGDHGGGWHLCHAGPGGGPL